MKCVRKPAGTPAEKSVVVRSGQVRLDQVRLGHDSLDFVQLDLWTLYTLFLHLYIYLRWINVWCASRCAIVVIGDEVGCSSEPRVDTDYSREFEFPGTFYGCFCDHLDPYTLSNWYPGCLKVRRVHILLMIMTLELILTLMIIIILYLY